MKILVITQSIDSHNTALGFFTRWVEEFSKRFDKVEVVCLFKGEHVSLDNVKVHSLGQELWAEGRSQTSEVGKKIYYIIKFFQYIWKYRNEYDVVFVHMNQEYVVLGGLFWKILGKKVYFWRNHTYGNLWTRIAIFFSNSVFCTADKSFTAQYKKTKIMPAGVDTKVFRKDDLVEREKNSLLVFGRIAPVKRIENALDTTATLLAKGILVNLSIVGDALPRDTQYANSLKKRAVESRIEASVHFVKGVDFVHAAQTYQSHEVCLNFTDSGSFDKTVIEALACGTKVLVSNTSMKNLVPEGSYTTGERDDILEKLERLLFLDRSQEEKYQHDAESFVKSQNLSVLMDELKQIISN